MATGCGGRVAGGGDLVDAGAADASEADSPDLLPMPPCVAGARATLPDGVSAGDDGRSWSRGCADHMLSIALVDDGTVRVRRVESAAATHRSWAVVGAPPVAVAARSGTAPDGALVVCTAVRTVRIDDACRVTLVDGDAAPLVEGDRYMTATHVITQDVAADAHFFGLGSQTGAADRRGRRLT
ncbi:MAG: hypothetical protein ACXVCV_04560, partial [Polyangia bacterium]